YPPAPGILIDSLKITDILDEAANRCTFTVFGTRPPPGAEVIITLGSRNNLERVFAGFLTDLESLNAADNPKWLETACACVDYSWWFNFRKVTKRYRTASAGFIIYDLIVTYAAVNGFTAKNVDPSLPTIAEITFTNENLPDAITRVCRL